MLRRYPINVRPSLSTTSNFSVNKKLYMIVHYKQSWNRLIQVEQGLRKVYHPQPSPYKKLPITGIILGCAIVKL